MYMPFPLIDDVIMESGSNRLLITNLYAEKDIIVRLPKPYTSRVFEVLLLSKYKVTLHTNSEVYSFLTSPPALTLTVGGSEKCVGRSLKIASYESYWRITSTSLPDRYIKFEENKCLDTLTTN